MSRPKFLPDNFTLALIGTLVTMAKVIFASHAVGAAILPLMLFHQIQLMVCAALAQRWGRRAEPLAKSLLPH